MAGHDALIDTLEKSIQSIRTGGCDDIDEMLKLKGPFDQGFTPLIAAWAEMSVCSSLVRMAQRCISDGADRETAVSAAGMLIGARANTLRERYHMADGASLMSAVAACVQASTDLSEVESAMSLLLEYIHFAQHEIRSRIPWHELSVAYEGAVRVKANWGDWTRARGFEV